MLDDQFISDSVQELRPAFREWAKRGRRIQSMLNAEPGQMFSSDDLAGRLGSNATSALANMSEYVSGRMTIIKDNIVGRAVSFPPKIEPAVLEEEKEEQGKQKRLFQFFHGIHNVLNDRQQAMWGGTSWDRMVLEHVITFGKVITIPHAATGPDGNLEFRADILDPLTCWHDFDSFPRRFGRDFMLGASDAERMLQLFVDSGKLTAVPKRIIDLVENEKRDKGAVQVTDFWVEQYHQNTLVVYRAVLIGAMLAGSWETDFATLPHAGATVHSSPGSYLDFSGGSAPQSVGSKRGVAADRVTRHAQSVLAPLYYINEQFRQYMSLIMEGLSNAMNPGREVIIQQGSPEEPPRHEQIGPGAMWIHDETVAHRIQDQATGNISQATQLFRDIIDEEFNRLANPVIFGHSNPGDSGYLQVNKVSHANAVFRESTRGASVFMKRTFDELARQFVDSGLTFKMDGWKHQGKGAPQFFPGDSFAPRDMPNQYVLNVEVLTDLPQNDAAKLEMFLAGSGQAFSKRQGRVHILDDEDPDLTQALIDQEEYEAMPIVKSRRFLRTMRQEIAALRSEAARAISSRERLLIEVEVGIAEQEYEAARRELQGEAPQPPMPPMPGMQGAGFSPMVSPPEAGVGTNPDRNAEARGEVSSFTGGRPRTEEVI